jgi:bifunctional non-homologous end joining protein LigD
MPLARLYAPFEHPDWIFEPKLDGFRAVAYVEDGICRLVSRNRNTFKTFDSLSQTIAVDLSGRTAILDGEIVRPGPDGRPLFYALMRRRGPFCYYAFDLLWLDGSDLRDQPLLERKALLRSLLQHPARAVLYVEHVTNGTDLFRVICERDMEGIVAKQASARYTPEATTWVKIKNREYSQAVGREDFFGRRKGRRKLFSEDPLAPAPLNGKPLHKK